MFPQSFPRRTEVHTPAPALAAAARLAPTSLGDQAEGCCLSRRPYTRPRPEQKCCSPAKHQRAERGRLATGGRPGREPENAWWLSLAGAEATAPSCRAHDWLLASATPLAGREAGSRAKIDGLLPRSSEADMIARVATFNQLVPGTKTRRPSRSFETRYATRPATSRASISMIPSRNKAMSITVYEDPTAAQAAGKALAERPGRPQGGYRPDHVEFFQAEPF